jgi:hypothetical protein
MYSLFMAGRYEASAVKSQGTAPRGFRESDMSDSRNFLDACGRQSAYCASSYHSKVFKLSLQFYSPFQKPIGACSANRDNLRRFRIRVDGRNLRDELFAQPAMKQRENNPRKQSSLRYSYREALKI